MSLPQSSSLEIMSSVHEIHGSDLQVVRDLNSTFNDDIQDSLL